MRAQRRPWRGMFEAPFKVRNHVERILGLPWVRFTFLVAGVRFGRRFRIFGAPILQRVANSEILFGDGLELRSTPRSNPLAPRSPCVFATREAGAVIRVGVDCGFSGAAIVAASRIEIGDRVMVGSNATIVDTDFHPLSPLARRTHARPVARPVRIEDDVFIGTQAMILKGVTVGRGAVVGAGAVVTRDVPPFTIVAGNPARVVGEVEPDVPSPAS